VDDTEADCVDEITLLCALEVGAGVLVGKYWDCPMGLTEEIDAPGLEVSGFELEPATLYETGALDVVGYMVTLPV